MAIKMADEISEFYVTSRVNLHDDSFFQQPPIDELLTPHALDKTNPRDENYVWSSLSQMSHSKRMFF